MHGKADNFLDDGMRGYIHNKARKEYWRVSSWYGLEDLVQDGYMCYAKCKARYAGTVTEQRHFMALVQTAFHNHIMTLAGRHHLVKESTISQLTPEGKQEAAVWDAITPPEGESATFRTLLAQAPAEFKQLISLLVKDGVEAYKWVKPEGSRKAVRQTTNEYLCGLIGKDPEDEDLVGQLKAYFG
jgi:DNA-directed RNA polymerase specialized sigma24 family protein